MHSSPSFLQPLAYQTDPLANSFPSSQMLLNPEERVSELSPRGSTGIPTASQRCSVAGASGLLLGLAASHLSQGAVGLSDNVRPFLALSSPLAGTCARLGCP